MSIQQYLDKLVYKFRNNLQDDLLGIYLHGSLAMGCYNTYSSDIDLLIVVKKKFSISIKEV